MGKILVINLGMKSIRSIIFDYFGNKLGSSSRAIETYLNEEYVLQDPSEWWEKAAVVVSESMTDLDKEDVDYLTVTASSSCLLCIDRDGNELDKCIMVSDKRAKEQAERLKEDVEFVKIRDKFGIKSDASLMIPRIMWIKENEPEKYEKTYKFLSPNDYVIGKMTGKYVTDIFNAQKYYYDTDDNEYPLELLRSLDIEKGKLPEVCEPGTEIGFISDNAAEWLGLSTKTKVVLSSYDAICSFFGSGVSEEGDSSDVSGTVTVFRTLTYKESGFRSDKVYITPYRSKKMQIVGGSNNMGGGLIEWVKQCYYINELYPYEIMEKDAREAQLGAGGLIFIPYLLGERAPIWNSNARGVFFGLERTHTRKEMTRAVFESAGYIVMDMISAVEAVDKDIKVGSIRTSGGLSRLGFISQLKADITGKEIQVLSEFETTATGAAMMALVGIGVFNTYKAAGNVFATVRMTIHPNTVNHQKYLKLFRLYKDTYSCMEKLYEERMNIVKELYHKHQVRIENL